MDFNREKFERMEQRAEELRAVFQLISDQLTDAISVETEALRAVLSDIRMGNTPDSAKLGGRFDDGRWLSHSEQYELYPDSVRDRIASEAPDAHILWAIDRHLRAKADTQRIRAKFAAHQGRMAAFNPAFSRCRAWVHQHSGNVHQTNVIAPAAPNGTPSMQRAAR